MALIGAVGWRSTCLILAAVALIFCVIIPGLFLKNKPEELGQVPDGPVLIKPNNAISNGPQLTSFDKAPADFTAKEALHTLAFWLITAYGALQMLVAIGGGTHIITFQFDIGVSATMAGMVGGVFSAFMGISQLGIGFLGLRFKMHTLAVFSMAVGIIGFSFLLFAHSLSMMLAYAVIFGASQGVSSIAMGNLIPEYFGRSNFPKIMGYSLPFNTFITSLGAPLAGYFRDTTGSYAPAFKIFLVLLIAAFLCILCARPPKHASLTASESVRAA